MARGNGGAVIGFIMILVLALIVVLAYQYGLMSVATSDSGVNLTGTQYQESYNQSVNSSKVAYSFLAFEPYFVAIAGVIGSLMLVFAFIKK